MWPVPLSYIAGFFQMLAARPDLFRVLTYADLDWAGDTDYEGCYPREAARWAETADPGRITILIHHDVDARPERTLSMVREELRLGLRSTILLHVRAAGLHPIPYRVDDAAFLAAQAAGCQVGYHQNALDQARQDWGRAREIFAADVDALRTRGFACRFTSAHGGACGPVGEMNNMLPMPEALRPGLRWIANAFGPRLDGRYSDSDNGRRHYGDLHAHAATWSPGRRYGVLLHPQYYADDCRGGRRTRPQWKETLASVERAAAEAAAAQVQEPATAHA